MLELCLGVLIDQYWLAGRGLHFALVLWGVEKGSETGPYFYFRLIVHWRVSGGIARPRTGWREGAKVGVEVQCMYCTCIVVRDLLLHLTW